MTCTVPPLPSSFPSQSPHAVYRPAAAAAAAASSALSFSIICFAHPIFHQPQSAPISDIPPPSYPPHQKRKLTTTRKRAIPLREPRALLQPGRGAPHDEHDAADRRGDDARVGPPVGRARVPPARGRPDVFGVSVGVSSRCGGGRGTGGELGGHCGRGTGGGLNCILPPPPWRGERESGLATYVCPGEGRRVGIPL